MISNLESLQDLVLLGAAGLKVWLVVFFRIAAMIALMPLLGEQVIPLRLRLGAAVALTMVVFPALVDHIPDPGDGFGLIAYLGTESVIGLALGLIVRLLFMTLQMAAAQMAQAASLSQMIGGIGPEPQPAIGQLMMFAGLALAAKAGLVAHIAGLAIRTYDLLPPGQLPAPSDMANWGLTHTAAAFTLSFSLSAPLVIGSVLYNIALGLINRAMPQLSVSFIGAPALTFGMLVLLALGLPALLAIWLGALDTFLSAPFADPR